MLMEGIMKEEKNIPFKNYIFLAIILIVSVIIVIYFYMWHSELYANEMNTPIMDEYLNVINYNELDTYLVENKEVIIYVSVLEDDRIRNFEKNFIRVVEEYSLNNKILYLYLTKQYKNDKLYNSIVNKYNLLDMPCILVFSDGIVRDVYSIEDRNYDINLLVSYLKIKGVIYD